MELAAPGEEAPALAAPANKPMQADQVAPAAAAAPAAPAALAEKQEAYRNEAAAPAASYGMMAKKKAGSEAAGAPAAKSAAPEVSVAAAVAPAPAESSAMADTANQSPEQWLARIRKLKQQGKLDEARKELAAFKKRYPAYPLPKDMEIR